MNIFGYIYTGIGVLLFTWLLDKLKERISNKIAYRKWRATLDFAYINRIRWYEKIYWLRWLSWFERFWIFR